MSDSSAPIPSSATIHWDAAAGSFVKLTLDSTRRVLARVDLGPAEKRGLLQHLFSTRVTACESRAMADLMRALGLLVRRRDQMDCEDLRLVSAALTSRFERVARRNDVEAFAESVEVTVHDLLMLAWAIHFSRAAPGQPLPALENFDADLPFTDPMGVESPSADFDAASLLAEVDEDADTRFGMR